LNLLSDVITYIRRIIKTPSDAEITDNLLIDYINRFWLMDVDARVQLFDLKTTYQFQTQPGVDQYNMPLYSIQTQPGNQQISYYPVYQGFFGPSYVNGISVPFYTQRNIFFNTWPNYVQNLTASTVGDGVSSNYTLQLPFLNNPTVLNNPQFALRGHVDITGVIANANAVAAPSVEDPLVTSTFLTTIPTTSVLPAVYITTIDSTGANVVVTDSGQFYTSNINLGLLMRPGPAPLGNIGLSGGYSTTLNVVDYATGIVNVTFTDASGNPIIIPAGQNINAQCYYYQLGLPRGVLFYNNTITLRSPPDRQYLVQLDAYLSPAAFLSTGAALPFGYMAEYIARGAARKVLSDTGDVEQFMFYEPLFKEQENLVWKRSQRIFTSTRTQTLYSQGLTYGNTGSSMGQGGT